MADYVYGNFYCSKSQRCYNAQYIKGWVDANWAVDFNPFIGMLANWEWESTLNPGIWESLNVGVGGFGLGQWTPASKLFNWIRPRGFPDWSMDGQLMCIRDWTVPFGQWRPTRTYNLSFNEFLQSGDKDIYWCTRAYMYCWEQPGTPHLNTRLQYATFWNLYFSGEEPPPITPDPDWPTGGGGGGYPGYPDRWNYSNFPLYFYTGKGVKDVN